MFRNPAVYFGAGAVGAGVVLLAANAGGHSSVWLWVGAAIAVLGVLLAVWAWRLQPFRITTDAVVFAKEVTFPFETLTATIEYGLRSDDMAQIAANRKVVGGPRRHLAYRAYGIHPNTALSTIHQIQAWKREGMELPLYIVATMLSIPDQRDVAVGVSVEFALRPEVDPVRVSDPC